MFWQVYRNLYIRKNLDHDYGMYLVHALKAIMGAPKNLGVLQKHFYFLILANKKLSKFKHNGLKSITLCIVDNS